MARWSETPLSRNDLLWQAKREGAVVSHPCAKNAQGWGTLSRNGAYRNHYRWATRQILMVPAASYPPLQRTQGRGTHSFNTGKMRVESWATRPRDDRAGEKPSRFSDGACGVLP